MTLKQCNSCKHHMYVKEFDESCLYGLREFMSSKNCKHYVNGELNQTHKELFKESGREYPFTELK